jgi:hypothetical protein
LQNETRQIEIGTRDGSALAWLHNKGTVETILQGDDTAIVEVSLSLQNWGQFAKLYPRQDK